ncbi:hypothetical protein Asppvi_010201 [Aspergillus pseudoviridinutans]|uniref:Uncharacterized protein n=1 Tax=Aspergillus pseudoviridinutans TaxID=1517512 RepID=A0A9P3BP53_9EURO|nr:uncharacterized protein Asppvi_010201 [Aspergillus pseudoviridinutans]GIJ91236.1 hypothetical protein Asppvi_010201 [Aspergillus pseudoviridinutans]
MAISSSPHNSVTQNNNTTNPPSIANLQNSIIFPTLWYRLHVLLYDLQHFNQRPDSRERLETVTDVSYIGPPYFNVDEATAIKNTVVHGKTLAHIIEQELQERLERRSKKRVDSGDFRVCAAHDLAPILAAALGTNLRQLDRDKRFALLISSRGLDLGDEKWEGLAAKSFAPKNKRER